MANSRSAINSIFNTVSSVANSVGSVANVFTTGIESVNDLVVDMRSKQQTRLLLGSVDYTDRLLEEMSEDIMSRQARINDYLDTNPKHKTLYDNAYAKLSACLTKD
jgi:hypothetical protein